MSCFHFASVVAGQVSQSHSYMSKPLKQGRLSRYFRMCGPSNSSSECCTFGCFTFAYVHGGSQRIKNASHSLAIHVRVENPCAYICILFKMFLIANNPCASGQQATISYKLSLCATTREVWCPYDPFFLFDHEPVFPEKYQGILAQTHPRISRTPMDSDWIFKN
jgi:hypothetical protein